VRKIAHQPSLEESSPKTILTADGGCDGLDWHEVVVQKEVTKGDRGGKGLEDERRLVLVPG
jgi:hypothetical protein